MAVTRELFGFGIWVLGTNILIFFITQGDDFFVGKVLGITMLGFYQLAYRISNTPATEITNVVADITFPAYSKLQDQTKNLKDAYLKVLETTTFFSIPIAGLIFALAPEFTRIFLGEKWLPIVPATQVLCFFGLLSSVNTTFGPVFYAKGKPAILTKIGAIQLIFLAIVIYPLTNIWGLSGTSLAVTLTNFICFIICVIEMEKLIDCKFKEIVAQMAKHILVTSALVGIIFLFKGMALRMIPLAAVFLVSIFVALVVYGIYGRTLIFSLFRLKSYLKT